MDHRTSGLTELKQYWWAVLIAIIFLLIGGGSVTLICSREGENSSITCIKQPTMLWVIPLKTKYIADVRGASLVEMYDNENDTTYRVELITGQGIVPLTSMYSSGSSTKSNVVDQVNAFVNSQGQSSLVVREPGLLSGDNLIWLAIGLPLSFFVNWIWEQFDVERSRAKIKAAK